MYYCNLLKIRYILYSNFVQISMFSFLIFLLYFLLCISPAQAYLDPGSGSYILYLIVAAIAGLFVTIKIYSIKVKNFFF